MPEQAEKTCLDLKKKLDNLEKAKAKEEDNEKVVMDSLRGETKVRQLCSLVGLYSCGPVVECSSLDS